MHRVSNARTVVDIPWIELIVLWLDYIDFEDGFVLSLQTDIKARQASKVTTLSPEFLSVLALFI